MSNEHIHFTNLITIRTVNFVYAKNYYRTDNFNLEKEKQRKRSQLGRQRCNRSRTCSFQTGSDQYTEGIVCYSKKTSWWQRTHEGRWIAHLSDIAIPQLKDHFVWDLCTSGIQLYSCLNCSTANGAGAEKWPAIATYLVHAGSNIYIVNDNRSFFFFLPSIYEQQNLNASWQIVLAQTWWPQPSAMFLRLERQTGQTCQWSK